MLEKMTSKHFIFFILAVTLVSLREYPSLFIATAERDTWIATIIACIIFFIYAYFIISVSKTTNNYSFRDIIAHSLGGFLGSIYTALFTIVCLLTAVEAASVEANALHVTTFMETPVWYALLFFIIPTIYICSKNLNTIVTIAIIIVSLSTFGSVLLLLLSLKYIHPQYLLPVFKSGFEPKYIFSIIEQLGALSAFALLLPLLNTVEEDKNLTKNVSFGLLVVCVLQIASIALCITTFGYVRAQNILYPNFVQSQRLTYGGFIESGEILFLLEVVCLFLLKYIICIFSILTLHKDRIKSKSRVILIISIFVLVCSYFAGTKTFRLFFALRIYQYICFLILFVMPLLIYFIYRVRAGKLKKLL